MRTSLQSYPSSSWSRRTPALSRRYHPSLEKPPHRLVLQPLPTEPFAALGENHRDPLSILPFSQSCLVHQSTLATVLRLAARPGNGTVRFPCCAAVGRAEDVLHHPSMDQRPRLESAYPFVCIKSTTQIARWTTTV
jgi:hypothetical protein